MGLARETVYYVGRSRRGMGNFRGIVPDKPYTLSNCELDGSMQRRAHDRGTRLIASAGRVYYRPQSDH